MSRIAILTADRNADIWIAYKSLKKDFKKGSKIYYLPELDDRFLHPVNLINFVKKEVKCAIESDMDLLIVTYSEEVFIGIRCVIKEYGYNNAELYFVIKKLNKKQELIKDYIKDNGSYNCRLDLFDAWDNAVDELFGLGIGGN